MADADQTIGVPAKVLRVLEMAAREAAEERRAEGDEDTARDYEAAADAAKDAIAHGVKGAGGDHA